MELIDVSSLERRMDETRQSRWRKMCNDLKAQSDWSVHIVAKDGTVMVDALVLILFSSFLDSALKDHQNKPYPTEIFIPDFNTRTVGNIVSFLRNGFVQVKEEELSPLSELLHELKINIVPEQLLVTECGSREESRDHTQTFRDVAEKIPESPPRRQKERQQSVAVLEEWCETSHAVEGNLSAMTPIKAEIISDTEMDISDYNPTVEVALAENTGIQHEVTATSDSTLSTMELLPSNIVDLPNATLDKAITSTPVNAKRKRGHSSELHECSICSKMFKQKQGLVMHLKHHQRITGPSFDCAFCSRSFKQKCNLVWHQSMHTKGKVVCQTCSFVCDTIEIQLNHDCNVSFAKETFTCNFCSKKFGEEVIMLVHMQQHNEHTKLQCPICMKTKKSLPILLTHVQEHRPLDNIKKSKRIALQKNFESLSMPILERADIFPEQRNRHSKESFDCRICGCHFQSGVDKVKHDCNISPGQPRYPCGVCNKVYGEKCIMLVHKQQHKESERYSCPICWKSVVPILNLISHVRKHLEADKSDDHGIDDDTGRLLLNEMSVAPELPVEVTSHTCNNCKVSFSKKERLLLHYQKHVNKSECECPYCQKVSASIAGAMKHITVHLGSPIPIKSSLSFTCGTCNTTFDSMNMLQLHKQTHHSSQTKLQCPFCNKEFKEKNTLLLHMKMHPGYSCKICGMKFMNKSILWRHRKSQCGNNLEDTNQHIKTTIDEVAISSADVTDFRNRSMREEPSRVIVKAERKLGPVKRKHEGEVEQPVKQRRTYGPDKIHIPDSCIEISEDTSTIALSYNCITCNATFNEESRLLLHEQIHKNVEGFQCPFCVREFKQINHALLHMTTHTGYRCKQCKKKFDNMILLRKHKANDCNAAGKVLKRENVVHTKERMATTEITTTEERAESYLKRFNCKQCNTKFANRSLLWKHKKNQCETANMSDNQSFNETATSEPRDVKVCITEKWFNCKVCETKFLNRSLLWRHKKQECGIMNTTNESANTTDELTGRHLITSPQIVESESKYSKVLLETKRTRSFSCKPCGMKFVGRSLLIRHKNVECGVSNSSIILVTGQELSTVRNRERGKFQQLDTDVKPRDWRATSDSVVNQLTAPKIKIHSCDTCKESFIDKNRLVLHQQLHKGRSELQCSFCNREFRLRRHILLHMRSHLGYTCKDCDIECENRSLFLKHNKYDCIAKKQVSKKLHHQNIALSEKQIDFSNDVSDVLSVSLNCINSDLELPVSEGSVKEVEHKHHKAARQKRLSEIQIEVSNDVIDELPVSSNHVNSEGKLSGPDVRVKQSEPTLCNFPESRLSEKEAEVSNQIEEVEIIEELTETENLDVIEVTNEIPNNLSTSVPKQVQVTLKNEALVNTLPVSTSFSSHLPKRELVTLRQGISKTNVTNFGAMSRLSLHTDTGPSTGLTFHNCSICSSTFNDKNKLALHEQIHIGKSDLHCPICDKVFKEQRHVLLHMQIHTGYNCKQCGTKFEDRRTLLQHKKTGWCVKDVNGDVSGSYGGVSGTVMNYGSATNQVTLEIPQSLPKESVIKSVVKLEIEKLQLQAVPTRNAVVQKQTSNEMCIVCSQVFATNYELKYHMQTHEMKSEHNVKPINTLHVYNEPLTCAVCHQKSLSIMGKLNHICSVDRRKFQIYKCDMCQRTFGEKCIMLVHKQQHIPQKGLTCPICCRNMQTKLALIHHVRQHTMELPVNSVINESVKTNTMSSAAAVCNSELQIDSLDCRICSQHFQNGMEKVEHHCRVGPNRPRFTCDICDMVYGEECVMLVHKQHHLYGNKTSCPICRMSIPSILELLSHVRSHTNELETMPNVVPLTAGFKELKIQNQTRPIGGSRLHVCELCENDFSNETHLMLHQQSHYGKSELQCPYCNKTFTSIEKAVLHVELIHLQKSMPTEVTQVLTNVKMERTSTASSQSIIALSESRLSQQLEQPVTASDMCYTCGMMCTSPARLLLHHQLHSAKSERDCPFCQRPFSTIANAVTHVNLIHLNSNGKKNTESQNSEEMRNNGGITRQIRDLKLSEDASTKHVSPERSVIPKMEYKETRKEKSLTCPICKKQYKKDTALGRHIKRHLGFVCKVCQKEFESEKDLKKHSKVHDKKTFIKNCDMCNTVFTSKTDYGKHKETCHIKADMGIRTQLKALHSKEEFSMLHRCTTCPRRFSSKAKLLQHMQTHQNKSILECPICNKQCKNKLAAISHIEKHLGYTCTICKKKFFSYLLYTRHKKFHLSQKLNCG